MTIRYYLPSVADRLSAFTTSIMGDARTAEEEEYILLLLPFEKDARLAKLLEDIGKRHPKATLDYHHIRFSPAWKSDISTIPEGRCLEHCSLYPANSTTRHLGKNNHSCNPCQLPTKS